MKQNQMTRSSRLGWLGLFTSLGTLLCCALPILLVTMGFGAVVASVTSQSPWLVTLVEQKIWMFSVSGGLLALSAWVIWSPRKTCPTDPDLALYCQQAKRWNLRLFWVALTIWIIGFFAAYLALPLRIWIEN
jgi:hypothetical protein